MSFDVRQYIRKQKVQVLLGLLSVLFSWNAAHTLAADSYSYDSIRYDIRINTDATVNVTEYETYNFVGEHHRGQRNISEKGIENISDISVIDSASNPLSYSVERLDATNPDSWGKYATFTENGEYNIEWYFDVRDTKNTWELRYKLHGAINFYDEYDELRWNLFTENPVPIAEVDATVTLPVLVDGKLLRAALYVHPEPENQSEAQWIKYPAGSGPALRFMFLDVPGGADMTIVPGWPKGIVDRGAYWKYWSSKHRGYLVAGAIALLIAVFVFRRYFSQDKPLQTVLGESQE